MDMDKYLRERGYETVSFAGTPGGLRDRTRGNVPAICLLDLGFGHYRPRNVTVIGFDDVGKMFAVHDGPTQNRLIGYDTFIREWARAGNRMLVAQPGTPGTGEKR